MVDGEVEMTREYTRKLLEMVKEGVVDKDTLIMKLLDWLQEPEVKEFVIFYFDRDKDDGQPDETQEWNDFDPDC
jgi:hypothetical protein